MSSNQTSTTITTENTCGGNLTTNGHFSLRVGAIFIILLTSMLGTLFPILTTRSRWLAMPTWVYEIAKYFGSGVIIATAFIHLLAPAGEALGSDCLKGIWEVYPWPEAISMMSVFTLFLIEIIAFRAGTRRLGKGCGEEVRAVTTEGERDGLHCGGSRATDVSPELLSGKTSVDGLELGERQDQADMVAQLVGAAILELGVLFHSLVIGLTLAVDPQFVTFFIVIIFHQMFEGLGLGVRLSELKVPPGYEWLPTFAGLLYSFITPLGLSIGLAVRNLYDPNTATALIVSGCLDSFSSGVLLYTGLVEFLARDFIFNRPVLIDASNTKLAGSLGAVLCGAGTMAVLGRWA